jgi:hypothetical protein
MVLCLSACKIPTSSRGRRDNYVRGEETKEHKGVVEKSRKE